MEHEFYPFPGVVVPVKINGKRKGNLLKMVFELDCDYPLNRKHLVPDLINRPVEIERKGRKGRLVEPEKLARHQDEGFKLKYVKYTSKEDDKWVNEIFYRWRKFKKEERQEDNLELANKL